MHATACVWRPEVNFVALALSYLLWAPGAAPLPAGPSHQPLLLLYLEQSLPCTLLIPAFRKQKQVDLCVNERHS